ncbi:leucine-rich repeat domain-containing protein, partial [Adlercreutzia murintestinalis]|uniref:leucine-rich repeat domain-containing protein n=1 Tax=Adlercreutzia murintestinalis TaxID=2941325 RepID=UPI00203C432E
MTAERKAWEQAGFKNFADPAQPGDTAEADGFAYTLLDDFTLSVRWTGEGAAPEELTIPQTASINDVSYAVSSIERDAFKGQESIRALTIPEGVRTIGASAFEDCTSLEKATIAGSVTAIEASAFKGCTSLAEVDLGGGLRTLGASAFENTAATAFWLPASVEQIAERAFAANEHLEYVVAEASVQDVDATVLADCTGVEIYVPYNADETYAWRAGVPATGNHLIPYGVSMPDAPLVLNQDETAELLGDTGYLKSEGRIDVRYAYDAAPISVDPSTGTVTAKQTGKTTVTAQLRLNDKLLASASRAVIVALAPKPEEPAEDDAESDEGDEGAAEGDHDHEGEEGCTEGVDAPDVSYRDQLFEEGDHYTSGAMESVEKTINRTVSLASMESDISTMSLSVASVASWNHTYSTSSSALSGPSGNKQASVAYDANTKTLTLEMGTNTFFSISKCGGSVNCSGLINSNAGTTTTHEDVLKWRQSRDRLNAIRKLVLKNFDAKNPHWFFSKMQNLETVEIQGNFFSNSYVNSSGTTKTSGVTEINAMFADCPSLRVIPNNMNFPSTVTGNDGLFGFTTHEFDTSADLTSQVILNRNQLVSGKLLTAYSGSDANVLNELRYSSNSQPPTNGVVLYRDLVTSYHTVTFDNQGGSGGHQTAGESSSATTKTYTIKVP